jgi:hypothetical protein
MEKLSTFQHANAANNHVANPLPWLQTYVHPCVIKQQPHIVYPRGLRENAPGLFSQLARYYRQQGYLLKEDQRTDHVSVRDKNKRRKWVPIALFTASLLFETSVFADGEVEDKDITAESKFQNIELQLISRNIIPKEIHYSRNKISKPRQKIHLQSEAAQFIFNQLSERYKKQETDPVYLVSDLKEIANYYSGFPQTVKLIKALKDKNWSLSFDENDWVTTGSGSMLQVDKAVIHFNTRSAAQLRLNNGCKGNPVCVASPADALLHELLHVYSMLVTSGDFLAQGGMNNVVYPYQHEYAVLDSERKLYASMSARDNIKRPQRREHTGRLVKAACATCIK